MRPSLRATARRAICFFVASALTFSSVVYGMDAALSGISKKLSQVLKQPLPMGYTEVPGPVFLGDNPSRDPVYRGGIWNDETLAMLQTAELQWGATPSQLGAQANLHPLAHAQIPGGGKGSGGGTGFPWEWTFQDGIPGGSLNSNTGNAQMSEPIVGWPSVAGTGVSLTLFHNAQGPFNLELGPQWSMNYDARVTGSNGANVTLRWGDGTAIPYTFDDVSNSYSPPAGIHDKLVYSLGRGWILTKPDQTQYGFDGAGRLIQILDRNGSGEGVVSFLELLFEGSLGVCDSGSVESDCENGYAVADEGGRGQPLRGWFSEAAPTRGCSGSRTLGFEDGTPLGFWFLVIVVRCD